VRIPPSTLPLLSRRNEVALTYVTAADKAEAVAKQIDADGGRALVVQADNADPGPIIAAVEQTVTDLGRLDILVNNAGIFTGSPQSPSNRVRTRLSEEDLPNLLAALLV
jgi:NAD(P)-dependent dehydrogenase (short-subunit alcohol dehydrogenase family)